MEKARIWNRVGKWFRMSGRTGAQAESMVESAVACDETGVAAGGDLLASGPRFRLARAPSTVERLEEEYARIVRLVESVQSHLESQGERTESIARSLSRLAESLESVPQATLAQSEFLVAIRQRLETDGACLKRVDENLSQLPRLADAHRETMVAIARQLDGSKQTGEKMAASLDGFQQAVTLLGDATTASAKALHGLRSDGATREERVVHVLEEQTRRLTLFAASSVGLALLAAAVAVIALLRS